MAARCLVWATVAAGFLAGALAAQPSGPAAADEALLRKANLRPDGPDLLDYFRRRTVGDAERRRIEELIRQQGDDSYAVRERATNELIEIGLPAVGLLRQSLNDPDVEIARRSGRCLERIERGVPFSAVSSAAARVIAARKPDGAAAVVLAHLPFADDETVADELRETLAALAARDGRIDPAFETALADALPARRAAAAEALIRTGLPAGLEAGRRALGDPSLDVRQRAAIALVVYAKDRDAVPKLIELLADLSQSAGWRVEEVLIRLAGDAAPTVSLGRDEVTRRQCRDAWLAWWTEHGRTVDLARLDGAPPTLGYTLLVVRERTGMGGRVLEVNAAKDVLWTISGLQMPMDAVVIGKDRVLIAEHLANTVSERDFHGNKIWSQSINMPVNVQRLPNGNTFVVCRNQVVEWSPDLKPLYSYQRPQSDVIGGEKTKDGEIILLTNQGACVRLDRDRKELKTFQPAGRNYMPFGGVDSLPDRRVLITLRESVGEFDANGQQHWSAAVSRPTGVQRLNNGNTLATSTGPNSLGVIELDRSGKPVWDFRFTDGSIPYRARRR